MKQIRQDAVEFSREKATRKAMDKTEAINQNKKITLREQMNVGRQLLDFKSRFGT